jgi:pyruvate/2-oxoglutarate/acetoin dehydrogenase E1 component
MPSNAADAAGLLLSAIDDPNPVVFVENKALYFQKTHAPAEPEPIPIGVASTLRRGDALTILATSRLVGESLQAAERLSAEGIEADVIDLRSLLPLDRNAICESVSRTGRAVVAHEAVRFGGFGAELAAQIQELAFDFLLAPIQRVGAPFMPVPLSPPLEDAYRPGADDVYAVARFAIEWDQPAADIPMTGALS